MKRIFFVLLSSILLFSCASDYILIRQNELEKKVEALEKSKSTLSPVFEKVDSKDLKPVGPVIDKNQLQQLTERGGAVKFRAFTCTTGETSACLDNYSSALLADGDLAIVLNSANNMVDFYRYDSDDATITQESDPVYIFPNGRPGNEVWKLFDGFDHAGNSRYYNSSGEGEYAIMAETDAGGFHIDNTIGGGSYIGLYPGASGHVVITPTTNGFGLNINDVGQDTGITLYVADGTDNLVFNGDFQFADGKQILDESGNPVIQINDGQEAEMIGQLKVSDINPSAISFYKVNDSPLFDDTAGDGDTDASLTADRITELLALKSNLEEEDLTTWNGATDWTNPTAAQIAGKRFHFTAAVTTKLPASATSTECTAFRIRDASEEATIDVQDTEKINLNGTAQAAGVGIQATGAGQTVVMCPTTDTDGSGTDGWETWGATSGWASE